MDKVKTIIIDDSEFFRKMMQDLCKSLELELLYSFSSGDSFLEKVKEGAYKDCELLLLDINLPGKSGKELLFELLKELPDLIVIMVSSLSGLETVNECLINGAANYINKDTSLQDMKDIIQSTLKMNGF
ncbi:MAG: response regulator [Velocimicrobium sp.]